MLRDWTGSEKVNAVSVHAERFFTRLIMKVDDYGCLFAHTSLLKANLFPLLLDAIREADISRWMAECQKAGLIVLYEADGKKYLQILDFRQRLDKAKAKYPHPPNQRETVASVNRLPELVNDFRAEAEGEVENEVESKEANASVGGAPTNGIKRANALVATRATAPTMKDYVSLVEGIRGKEKKEVVAALKDFLAKKPLFAAPYIDYWNIAVEGTNVPQVRSTSDSRDKQVRVRVREEGFDFNEIVRVMRGSPILMKESSWFSFDWVFKNDKNYLKVLEGNYE